MGESCKHSGITGQELAPFLLPRWWQNNVARPTRAGTESVAASILSVFVGVGGGRGELGELCLLGRHILMQE